jgi:hypothetical protein
VVGAWGYLALTKASREPTGRRLGRLVFHIAGGPLRRRRQHGRRVHDQPKVPAGHEYRHRLAALAAPIGRHLGVRAPAWPVVSK